MRRATAAWDARRRRLQRSQGGVYYSGLSLGTLMGWSGPKSKLQVGGERAGDFESELTAALGSRYLVTYQLIDEQAVHVWLFDLRAAQLLYRSDGALACKHRCEEQLLTQLREVTGGTFEGRW